MQMLHQMYSMWAGSYEVWVKKGTAFCVVYLQSASYLLNKPLCVCWHSGFIPDGMSGGQAFRLQDPAVI